MLCTYVDPQDISTHTFFSVIYLFEEMCVAVSEEGGGCYCVVDLFWPNCLRLVLCALDGRALHGSAWPELPLSLWWGWAWGLWLGMWGFHSSHQDLENVAVSGAGKQSVVCWAVLWVFACAALQSAEVNALLGVASFFVVFFLLLLINGSINGSRVHNVILK